MIKIFKHVSLCFSPLQLDGNITSSNLYFITYTFIKTLKPYETNINAKNIFLRTWYMCFKRDFFFLNESIFPFLYHVFDAYQNFYHFC